MIADLMKLPGAEYVRANLYKWPALRSLAVAYCFPVEKQLVRGRHKAKSDHPSIIHFSINKAATQYVRNVLMLCAEENSLTPVQFNQFAWMTNTTFMDRMSREEFETYKRVFSTRGYCYTVFARMVEGIPDLDTYKKILVVRDPRDILTSHYFSQAYSHPLPADPDKAEAFLSNREKVRQKTIEEFVVDFSDRVAEVFDGYMKHLIGRDNLHVARYEDMITDFPSWLDDLLGFCALQISDRTRTRLIETSAGSVPAGQRPDHKRRQVVPGDHRRKLQPETIEVLNERFGPALDCFGYAR
ncbi:MAG: sulfotransferase domain-containing protein [Rhodospirillales bacterium]|nr:sulfotransferase domain-containing protein [Rhodospirillales bacterium]